MFPVKKIGVVGGGTVGHATARSYMEFAEVRVHDTDPCKSTHSLAAVLDTDLVFVCLPTPQMPLGKKDNGTTCDLSYLRKFFLDIVTNYLAPQKRTLPLVLKSTVPVGTTNWFRRFHEPHLNGLIHSPEFLTARCAVTDALLPARNVVGGYEYSSDPTASCHLYSYLVQTRFPGVPVYSVSNPESEFVKLMQNSFFATKVAFFNEMREFCDVTRLTWTRVLEAVLADGRIAHSHTKVPGPDGRFGFGGACLPKDLAFTAECMNQLLSDSTVCSAALKRNEWDRDRRVTRSDSSEGAD